MSIKLYSHPFSAWSTKVLFLLEELKIPYENIHLALEKKVQHTPEFESINPFGRVPAIQDGDFCLSESAAILRYLVQKAECFDLYPANLQERARVDQWCEFSNWHICLQLIDLAWHRSMAPKFGAPSNQARIDDCVRTLSRDFPKLEAHLSNRNYLVGSHFTLADLNLVPFIQLHDLAHWDLTAYPAVTKWFEHCSLRTSWIKVKKS